MEDAPTAPREAARSKSARNKDRQAPQAAKNGAAPKRATEKPPRRAAPPPPPAPAAKISPEARATATAKEPVFDARDLLMK